MANTLLPVSNMSKVVNTTFGNIFDTKPQSRQPYKRHSVDLVEASCSVHRRFKNGELKTQYGISSVTPNEITDEDRQHAAEIKEYYSKKLMVLKLKGHKLSNFRNDLVVLITTKLEDGGYTYVSTHLQNDTYRRFADESFEGMAHRLPEFYEYDMGLEKVFESSNREIKPYDKTQQVYTLKFLKKLTARRRLVSMYEYWFELSNKDRVCLTRPDKDPLNVLFDMLVESGPININGRFKREFKDDREFLRLQEKWSLVL